MRVLHVSTRHRRGGAERNVLHLAAWQQAAGHAVELAVGSDSDVSDVPADIPVRLVPHLVRRIHPLDDLRAYLELRRLIGTGQYDVIHTHLSKAGILGRLAARGRAPIVLHTIHMSSFGPAYGRLGSPVFLALERICARVTDVIVAVGEELRDTYLATGVGRPEQYAVVRSPIEIGRFTALRWLHPGQRGAARERLGVPGKAPVVAAIGSLEARKRFGLIIERLAPVLGERRVILVIAGEGQQREALERQIRALGLEGSVRLVGHVDAADVLGVAGVLVHAATAEGVPQVVIQALAAGVPVVATEVTGLREVPDADISVIGPDGSGMLESVGRALRAPARPVDPSALEPWSPTEVEREIGLLHDRIAVLALASPTIGATKAGSWSQSERR